LVIDDEDSVRRAAQSILERYGYQVVLAQDGKAGIDLFKRMVDEISLVLLDMTMPVVSGEKTLERLKAIRGDVRVVLSSGYNETEAMGRFVGQELAGFIQKPFTSTSLAQQVGMALGANGRELPARTS
jgi:DNA-binding NtrC family response regulator